MAASPLRIERPPARGFDPRAVRREFPIFTSQPELVFLDSGASAQKPRAVIDTKPELEIYADDVKCAHGASVGELDETALFYLRTRGIPDAEARHMLIEGFLREPVEEIAEPALRDYLLRRLARRLDTLEE